MVLLQTNEQNKTEKFLLFWPAEINEKGIQRRDLRGVWGLVGRENKAR